jgi:peptidoglycan/xylan/chitin deacetylase (PgdA/CDA1 family)
MPFLAIDRLATLYLFRPLQGIRLQTNSRIPILMYHSISDEAEADRHPYFQTVVSPAVFAEHMKLLHENGHRVLPLAQAANLLGKKELPEKAAVITFDDGFQDFRTNAFPVLERYEFPATVFLPTQYLADTPARFKGKPCLTWSEVRELQAAGIHFGSHTVTHPQLWELTWTQIEQELRESRLALEDNLGAEVQSFSYPYAFPEQDAPFSLRLRSTLQACGYQVGVSTILGCAEATHDRFFLPRLPVNACDDSALFRAKLAGAYDWLHVPQYVGKLAKRRSAASLNFFSVRRASHG